MSCSNCVNFFCHPNITCRTVLSNRIRQSYWHTSCTAASDQHHDSYGHLGRSNGVQHVIGVPQSRQARLLQISIKVRPIFEYADIEPDNSSCISDLIFKFFLEKKIQNSCQRAKEQDIFKKFQKMQKTFKHKRFLLLEFLCFFIHWICLWRAVFF